MVGEGSIRGFELQEPDSVQRYRPLVFLPMNCFDCPLSWAYHSSEGSVFVGSLKELLLSVVAILAVLALVAAVVDLRFDTEGLGIDSPSRMGHIPTS